jgi:hypothetical protein
MATVPINSGSLPDWNEQLNDPKLFNMFVDSENKLQFMPDLSRIGLVSECRAIWETRFDGGSYIVVTDDEIYRIKKNGSISYSISILNSSLPIEITENLKNQITIVDGKNAYVLEQQNSDNFIILGPSNNFNLTNPGSCRTINSFTIVLDTNTGLWQISNANDALNYDSKNIQQITPQIGQPIAVRVNNNNVFFLGSSGIEKWMPTQSANIYLFPIQKNMDFEVNVGALSQSSITSNLNAIYFLSSRFIPMQLTSQGCTPLPLQDKEKQITGIAKIISNYVDNDKCYGSFYSFKGNDFYQLSFLNENITWVYCLNSGTFSNTNDYIIGSAFKSEIVITRNGVYSLNIGNQNKEIEFISDTYYPKRKIENNLSLLNGIEIELTQGLEQNEIPEYLGFSLSVDRKTWSNTVRTQLPKVGQTQNRTRIQTNRAGRYFTFRFKYFGSQRFTIESMNAYIEEQL